MCGNNAAGQPAPDEERHEQDNTIKSKRVDAGYKFHCKRSKPDERGSLW